MPEKESPPIKSLIDGLTDAEAVEVLEGLSLVRRTAEAQANEVDEPDTRALEGEDTLNIAGDKWERNRKNALLVAQIFLLLALFGLVLAWLLSIAALLVMVGFHVWGFILSDAIVIAYMTTTTISVIGLFKIAANWLFSVVDKPPKSK
ncbi:MAG: hypothetical protein ABR607_07370 [Pyrinomonadaceae bacterium]